MHILAYGLATAPVVFGRPKSFLMVVVLVSIWGGIVELAQPLVGRNGSTQDALANAVGSFTGAVAARSANAWIRNRTR
jgi:VanZ family protein